MVQLESRNSCGLFCYWKSVIDAHCIVEHEVTSNVCSDLDCNVWSGSAASVTFLLLWRETANCVHVGQSGATDPPPPTASLLQQRRQSNGLSVGGSCALDWDPEWPGAKYKRNKVLQFRPCSQLAFSPTAKKTHIYNQSLT